MPPSVLVTGGAGYIGSHTCKALAEAGFRPVVLDNLSRGQRDAVRWGPLERHDLADTDALRRVIRAHRVEAVLHFAAYAYVGESVASPRLYFDNNVRKTLGLLDVMAELGVRPIVFSSTCATYGVPTQVPIAETHPQQPINPYGETKLIVERALHWYGQAEALRWVSLRYFNAAGADPDGEIGEDHDPETHLIPLALQAAAGRRPALEIYGTDYPTPDGTAVRDYIHVSDLADAHVRALRHLLSGGPSAAFNLGTGRGHSVREVIAAVERVTGRRVPVREAPRRTGDPPVLTATSQRAEAVLGWRPRVSGLDRMVETAWQWEKKRDRPTVVPAGGNVVEAVSLAS